MLKCYAYEISGQELVEDIHPLAHMVIYRWGEEASYAGEVLGMDAEDCPASFPLTNLPTFASAKEALEDYFR